LVHVDALHRILNIISFHEHDYVFDDANLFYYLDRKQILEQMTDSDSNAAAISSVVLNKLSKIFEAKLFSLAQSRIDAYSDHNDLESRIRILAMQLGKKIERKQQGRAVYPSGKTRQQIIESKLGKPMVEEILALVSKVKTIQRIGFNNFLSREEKCTGRRSCSGGSCRLIPKASSSKPLLVPGIPLAMKNIYLNTRLLDAFSKTNSVKTQESLLALLDAVKWSALIEETKKNCITLKWWDSSIEE